MVQLKQVSLRLKSIKNIQKITKTMKMVSASKFTKAERELQAARPFGYGPRKFYESSQLVKGALDEIKPAKKKAATPQSLEPTVEKIDDKEGDKKLKRIYVAMTSDRGLCGGVHSGVARRIKKVMLARKAEVTHHKLVCVGDKSRSIMRQSHAINMLVSVKDVGTNRVMKRRYLTFGYHTIGRISPIFADASIIAAAISESGYIYDVGEIFFNKYFTPVKYEMTIMPFFNKFRIESAPNMHAFDDVDDDQLECYAEWTLAALMYYALKEGAASEQSSRMAAMDNATKNAEDMIRRLTLLYNRTRQAVITRELIEIISGAAALK